MKKIILSTMLISGVSAVALANQQSPTSSALEFSRTEVETKPQGLMPFLGIGGGYTGYENAQSAEGVPANLKLLGSYYLPGSNVVLDLGYGVNNQQYSQSSGTSNETSQTSGVLEFAARYRWDNRWQAGIVANQIYEQGPELSADQADAHFVGLQAMREFNMTPSWLARIGARAMTLTNNTDGNVMMYMIDLQMGWNPNAYATSVRQTSYNPNDEFDSMAMNEDGMGGEYARPVAGVTPGSALASEVALTSLVPSDTNIEFRTSQASISSADEKRLARIAKVLADNKDLYDRVEVRGYADSTGPAEFNQRLSQERANKVTSVLRQNGLSASEVISVGKGASDTSGILSQDRRAELVFVGVKDEEKLREALSSVE